MAKAGAFWVLYSIPINLCKGAKNGEFQRIKLALSLVAGKPYIRGATQQWAAMVIKCHRNKPFGPGGSTRRLHQSRLISNGIRPTADFLKSATGQLSCKRL